MNINTKKVLKNIRGFSLIEMLVTVFVFSILGIVVAQSLALSLRSAKKSESASVVKENVEFALSTMERLLRNATSITCTSATQLDYLDEFSRPTRFSCITDASGSYIASGAANLRITATDVTIICNEAGYAGPFTCPAPAVGVPPAVLIDLRGQHARLGNTLEGARFTSSTRILLRTY